LTSIIFLFVNPTQTLTRHTYLNTNSQALIISFISVFGMYDITLCIRTWYEVRNFASQKFRLTPDTKILEQEQIRRLKM